MISPIFILCSVLLLSGVYAEDINEAVTEEVAATSKKKFVSYIFFVSTVANIQPILKFRFVYELL